MNGFTYHEERMMFYFKIFAFSKARRLHGEVQRLFVWCIRITQGLIDWELEVLVLFNESCEWEMLDVREKVDFLILLLLLVSSTIFLLSSRFGSFGNRES